jgi:hypothetical protein
MPEGVVDKRTGEKPLDVICGSTDGDRDCRWIETMQDHKADQGGLASREPSPNTPESEPVCLRIVPSRSRLRTRYPVSKVGDLLADKSQPIGKQLEKRGQRLRHFWKHRRCIAVPREVTDPSGGTGAMEAGQDLAPALAEPLPVLLVHECVLSPRNCAKVRGGVIQLVVIVMVNDLAIT